MHDAVAFERHGIPGVVLVTEVFEQLALQTARQLGLEDYQPLVVPHPVFNRDERWMRAHVDGLVERAAAALTEAP